MDSSLQGVPSVRAICCSGTVASLKHFICNFSQTALFSYLVSAECHSYSLYRQRRYLASFLLQWYSFVDAIAGSAGLPSSAAPQATILQCTKTANSSFSRQFRGIFFQFFHSEGQGGIDGIAAIVFRLYLFQKLVTFHLLFYFSICSYLENF